MGTGTMPSKRPKKDATPPAMKQMNIRVPMALFDRLEKAAELLASDPSHLVRLILVEKLPEYEERARRAHGIKEEGE
jgi:hypothetical protein